MKTIDDIIFDSKYESFSAYNGDSSGSSSGWEYSQVQKMLRELVDEVINAIEKDIRHYVKIDSNYVVSADHEIFENLKDDLI